MLRASGVPLKICSAHTHISYLCDWSSHYIYIYNQSNCVSLFLFFTSYNSTVECQDSSSELWSIILEDEIIVCDSLRLLLSNTRQYNILSGVYILVKLFWSSCVRFSPEKRRKMGNLRTACNYFKVSYSHSFPS